MNAVLWDRAFWGRQRVAAVLLVAVCAAYVNHFGNGFHFDDFHAVNNNPAIRSLTNLPAFFTDVTTSSVLPSNRAWRPLVTASFAFDYWMGGGLNPVAFHAVTFLLYLLQVSLLFLLFERMFELARPERGNRIPAAFAAACYGLHPACAETVNYVSQRAELYSTLGVVAALYLYIARPGWRRYGLYLLPLAAAELSKAPALIFPALLVAYLFLFERPSSLETVRALAPAVGLTAVIAVLLAKMTPATFVAGASSPLGYRLTQPYVALRYFGSFFLPVRLSADTDLGPVSSVFEPQALAGFAFLAVLLTVAVLCSGRRRNAPAVFGLWWFLLALAPTSLFALAEVENDHRMFFPFVGLAMSVTWTLILAFERVPRRILVPAALLVLAACTYGTYRRNQVWKDESSLWADVVMKSPRNGRGLMNYGVTLLGKGDIQGALRYFERALAYTPNYNLLQINLGVAYGQLLRDDEAERHFQRAIALTPGDALPYYYYARWLNSRGRMQEAWTRARTGAELNPGDLDIQNLIASILARSKGRDEELARMEQAALARPMAETYLGLSLRYHQLGRYADCIRLAREALKLKPDYAEAYNNIAASHESLGEWDLAIEAAREALRLKPGFALARNNLAWSEEQKARQIRVAKK